MAYLKPPFFVRNVFNPIAMATGLGGAETLLVKGRRTGTLQRLPVIPVEHGGGRYVASTRGESDWVKNLRAAGGGEIRRKRGATHFSAVELPVEERSPVIAAYRAKAGRAVEAYWKQLPEPADHPVFRIDSV